MTGLTARRMYRSASRHSTACKRPTRRGERAIDQAIFIGCAASNGDCDLGHATQLSWNAVTGAQSYRIYWWNGFRAVLIGSISSSRTSVTITGLNPGSTNQFLVEAVGNGQVADSAWVSLAQPSRTVTGRRAITFG